LSQPLFWVLFNAFVLGMLAIDLWFFHRPAHAVKFREALAWSLSWMAMAAGFAVLVYFWRGREPAMQFTAGYLIELALSVDNLFVFLLIFRYFRVPADLQHKVLFWGILGAIILRGVFILVGIGLIHAFHWVTYIFGLFLIYSGAKLFRGEEVSVEPEKNPVLRLFRRWMPVTEDYEGESFFVRRQVAPRLTPQNQGANLGHQMAGAENRDSYQGMPSGMPETSQNQSAFRRWVRGIGFSQGQPGLYATPLFAVLLIVETTDLLFATDSIPAVLAITLKAFIVYTSNVFALLGLRSMYFVLSGMMEVFHYLHYGLSVVLIFIGAKMLAADYYPIPTTVALAVVAAVLLISVLASLVHPKAAE
jgi:tellurite resistance protein TerC